MHDRDTGGRQQALDGTVIGLVVARADMLEHPDRDDPVEASLEFAIVDELEADAVVEPRLAGAAAGDAELLFGQGDAQHFDVLGPGEHQREAAPAAADVEHSLARRKHQLGGQMLLLRGLGIVERLVGLAEIRA